MPVDAPVYPVGLVLLAKRCLVVGGGAVAARKAAGLLAADAEVHVVAKEVLGPMARLKARLARIEERPYRRGEVAGYWLAMAATGDPKVNQAVHDDAEAAGVWMNSADDPQRCSFVLPAVARQGPVSVAVSTSGYSPALARWLKEHASEHMGPEVTVLAELLAGARAELHARGRSTEDVDWRPALGWEMLDLIREGRLAEARERLEACLSQ